MRGKSAICAFAYQALRTSYFFSVKILYTVSLFMSSGFFPKKRGIVALSRRFLPCIKAFSVKGVIPRTLQA